MEDAKIIDLYFARDEQAVTETANKYGSYCFTLANSILPNKQDAEEAVSDTYWKTWNAIPPERPNIFHAFLAKITRNLSLSRIEKTNRKKRVPAEAFRPLDEVQEFLPDPHDLVSELQAATVRRILAEYLDSVPDRRVYVFMSRYFYSFTVAHIAKRLSCSTSSVNRELAEIKRELRARFEKEGIEV